ncbi:hypothetical protein BC833DRAFT_619753 [Globomyces pollinis-pini]|nr:hypothetical protein BC833DRAFT_619753 [Globomyces pollinis-pini]
MFDSLLGKSDPLSDAHEVIIPDDRPGANTTQFNFEIITKIGWIAWKDKEASLYTLFERTFGATRCELKISDTLDDFVMEIEIPTENVDKFQKQFWGKTLAKEIDKIHGIEPSVCSWTDARLSKLIKSAGSTLASTHVKSSCENLTQRFDMLEKCANSRNKEVAAMMDMCSSIMEELTSKFDALSHRIDMKVYEKCGSKFDMFETRIMLVLKDELSFLAAPLVFKHPPDGVTRKDTGIDSVVNTLNASRGKKPSIKRVSTGTISGPVAPSVVLKPKVVTPITTSIPKSSSPILPKSTTTEAAITPTTNSIESKSELSISLNTPSNVKISDITSPSPKRVVSIDQLAEIETPTAKVIVETSPVVERKVEFDIPEDSTRSVERVPSTSEIRKDGSFYYDSEQQIETSDTDAIPRSELPQEFAKSEKQKTLFTAPPVQNEWGF